MNAHFIANYSKGLIAEGCAILDKKVETISLRGALLSELEEYEHTINENTPILNRMLDIAEKMDEASYIVLYSTIECLNRFEDLFISVAEDCTKTKITEE